MILTPHNKKHPERYFSYQPKPNIFIGNLGSSVKDVNEDRIGHTVIDDSEVICIADAHWGIGAAELVCRAFLEDIRAMPRDRDDALRIAADIEGNIYKDYSEESLSTEAAFITLFFNSHDNTITIAAYGDCRCMIIHPDGTFTTTRTTATWLGVNSRLRLRNRLSAREALVWEQLKVSAGDKVIVFSDGIDECIYEQPTISYKELANICVQSETPPELAKTIFEKVTFFGAEDDASLGIVFC